MKFLLTLTILFSLCSCAALKKDNPSKDGIEKAPTSVVNRVKVYREEGKRSIDRYGLVVSGISVGDSALFSCLAYAGGLTSFNVSLLFTDEGKPVRHPDMSPVYGSAPISKDMVNGILWCLFKLGKDDKPTALRLIKKMIDYGREHKKAGNWVFCDEKDKELYEISLKDFLGKCVMTPAIIKDTYRLAVWLGRDCDAGCQISRTLGVNIPTDNTGFNRHLAILTTARNGLIEGSLNDNSVSQLRKAAEAEPNNGIYQAAYNRFYKGNQSNTWKALNNEILFPKNNAATGKNYCTEYLWQRDETRKEDLVVKDGCIQFFDPETKASIKECDLKNSDDTPIKDGEILSRLVYNKDWLPCSKDHPKSMAEWLFAWALATGEI